MEGMLRLTWGRAPAASGRPNQASGGARNKRYNGCGRDRPPICKVGRPRINWLLRVCEHVWNNYEVYKGDEGATAKFEHTHRQHLTLSENAAKSKIF